MWTQTAPNGPDVVRRAAASRLPAGGLPQDADAVAASAHPPAGERHGEHEVVVGRFARVVAVACGKGPATSGGRMDTVPVVFTNGSVVSFAAQEFDVDLTQDEASVNMYPYMNARGEGSYIHLRPAAVAGVFLTRAEPLSHDRPVYYTGAGGGA